MRGKFSSYRRKKFNFFLFCLHKVCTYVCSTAFISYFLHEECFYSIPFKYLSNIKQVKKSLGKFFVNVRRNLVITMKVFCKGMYIRSSSTTLKQYRTLPFIILLVRQLDGWWMVMWRNYITILLWIWLHSSK